MDENEPANYLADLERALAGIGDPRMRGAGLVQSQKVGVLGHENTAGLGCEKELLFVGCAAQTGLDCAGYINAPAAEPVGHTRRDVLVQVKANAHFSAGSARPCP